MKCPVCNNIIEGRGKTCSKSCRKKLSRMSQLDQSVTESVTSPQQSVTKQEVSVSKDVTDNWYLEENKQNYNPDPLKRMTIVPKYTVTPDWYKSEDFKNLNEELSKKSIEQLTDEHYYIPVWKSNGFDHNPIEDIKSYL